MITTSYKRIISPEALTVAAVNVWFLSGIITSMIVIRFRVADVASVASLVVVNIILGPPILVTSVQKVLMASLVVVTVVASSRN
jgi:hypothetical protein